MRIVRGYKEPIYEYQSRRRAEVLRLFETTNLTLTAIAADTGVSRKYVSRWHALWTSGDTSFLTAEVSGRKDRLTDGQKALIKEHVIQGPLAAGYVQEVWTQRRIADLISKLTGVDYHPNFIRVLMASMDISYQKPALRTKQRNEKAVKEFLDETWAAAKRGLSKTER
ncbi:MAG: winged helix-turn-helix domain-containing protein [Capsulimonadaceae bacterium]|nr:winged helix-turn-helix domain-containing protein [Capsulimonadaceae bacterium]